MSELTEIMVDVNKVLDDIDFLENLIINDMNNLHEMNSASESEEFLELNDALTISDRMKEIGKMAQELNDDLLGVAFLFTVCSPDLEESDMVFQTLSLILDEYKEHKYTDFMELFDNCQEIMKILIMQISLLGKIN